MARNALVLYAKTGEVVTATGNGPVVTGDGIDVIAIDIVITDVAGTSPTLDTTVERRDANGNWHVIHTFAQAAAAGVRSVSIGPGASVGAVLTGAVRLRHVVGGVTPSFTLATSIVGQSVG